MTLERGSALIEAIVLGSVSVLLILSILAAATTLQSARESVEQASQVAAAEAVRTGDLDAAVGYVARVAPDADVQVRTDGTGVTVTVGRSVQLPGLGGFIERWVEATARSDLSSYRSHNP
jgi:hypothetical protein